MVNAAAITVVIQLLNHRAGQLKEEFIILKSILKNAALPASPGGSSFLSCCQGNELQFKWAVIIWTKKKSLFQFKDNFEFATKRTPVVHLSTNVVPVTINMLEEMFGLHKTTRTIIRAGSIIRLINSFTLHTHTRLGAMPHYLLL